MSLMSFDYLPRPYLDGKKLKAIYQPIVMLRIGANHKIYPNDIECLVDSGADYNLFPADIGELLGINITKGKVREHIGIANIGIKTYTHPVNLYIRGKKLITEVDFSYDHLIPLVGREGFFRHFKQLIFNQKELRLDLEY
jgi:hypothetical protein